EIGIDWINDDAGDITDSGDKALQHIEILGQIEDAATAAVDLGDGGDDDDVFTVSLRSHQARNDGVRHSVFGPQYDHAVFWCAAFLTRPLPACAEGRSDEGRQLRFTQARVTTHQRGLSLCEATGPEPIDCYWIYVRCAVDNEALAALFACLLCL